jgi:hypothetical protein
MTADTAGTLTIEATEQDVSDAMDAAGGRVRVDRERGQVGYRVPVTHDTSTLFARSLLRRVSGVCLDRAGSPSITLRHDSDPAAWLRKGHSLPPLARPRVIGTAVTVEVYGLHGMHACAARGCEEVPGDDD